MSGPSRLWVGRALADVGGADPSHRALHVDPDGTITWTGADPAAAPPAAEVMDLGEVWLTPGFVDAHVHATATGLAEEGVSLSEAGTLAQALAMVGEHAARTPGPVIHGSGWDDQGWPERRPPTGAELSAASGGRPTVLTRVDGHSCVVDAGLLATLDLRAVQAHVDRGEDGQPTGWLREDASAIASSALWRFLTDADLRRARDAVCRQALALGITSFHEMGIPEMSEQSDTIAWATGDWPLEVHAYWASMDVPLGGPLRPGGDLFLDGSIGSCTAATHEAYLDNDGHPTNGTLFHDDDTVADFFIRCTRAGVGAGVHAIGDAATAQAIRAIARAARECGLDAVRAARHRVEHLELMDARDLPEVARLGVVASVQPAFDATWNGPDGLYEHRFGRQRADRTNPFAALARVGALMAFSSDSTVTPMDPWGGILAAERHHGGERIDRRTALRAATLGGHVAVSRDDRVGALRPGLRADVVAWPEDPLTATDPSGWRPLATVVAGALAAG